MAEAGGGRGGRRPPARRRSPGSGDRWCSPCNRGRRPGGRRPRTPRRTGPRGSFDGLGDRAVDPFLRRRLDREVVLRGQPATSTNASPKTVAASPPHRPPQAHGAVRHLLGPAGAVGHQHGAPVAVGEHRLDAPRRHCRRRGRSCRSARSRSAAHCGCRVCRSPPAPPGRAPGPSAGRDRPPAS